MCGDVYFINMIVNRIAKALFSTGKREVIPKAPRLLAGELEPFRFEAENAQLYDGYSLDELYGVKMGAKHPPAVKAEMAKYWWCELGIISLLPWCSWLEWVSFSTFTPFLNKNLKKSKECRQPSILDRSPSLMPEHQYLIHYCYYEIWISKTRGCLNPSTTFFPKNTPPWPLLSSKKRNPISSQSYSSWMNLSPN